MVSSPLVKETQRNWGGRQSSTIGETRQGSSFRVQGFAKPPTQIWNDVGSLTLASYSDIILILRRNPALYLTYYVIFLLIRSRSLV